MSSWTLAVDIFQPNAVPPSPQMVARFTINAVPALAVLDRGTPINGDDSHVSLWGSIRAERPGTPPGSLNQRETVVPLPRTLPRKQ